MACTPLKKKFLNVNIIRLFNPSKTTPLCRNSTGAIILQAGQLFYQGFSSKMTKNLLKNIGPVYLLIVIAAAFGVYFNDLLNDFVMDDRHVILKNAWIMDFRYIPKILTSSVWAFQDEQGISNHYRPLHLIYYMAVYYLVGIKEWGFHLLNNLFHTGSSIFVYLIALRLFEWKDGVASGSGVSENSLSGSPLLSNAYVPALFTALVFATHPVNTEAVVWVSATSEVSFAFFCFASFYFYISSAGKWQFKYWLSVLFFLLGAMSKETSVFLPIAMVAYDLTIGGESIKPVLRWIKRYAPFVAAGIFYLTVRSYSLGGIAPMRNTPDMAEGDIAINFLPLVWAYIYKLVLPVELIFYEYLTPASSITDGVVLFSILVIVIIIIAAVLFWRKNRLALFALLWIFIPMLPVFQISLFKGHPALAERYLYVPTMGFGILIMCAYLYIIEKKEVFRLPLLVALIAVICLYSYATMERNRIWRTEITIWEDTIKKAPDNKYAFNNLGILVTREGEVDKGISLFKKALEIDPMHHPARNNLGAAFAKSGRIREAAVEFSTVLKSDPKNSDARGNLSKALMILNEEE